jgi:AraC-like DNA-binding protein
MREIRGAANPLCSIAEDARGANAAEDAAMRATLQAFAASAAGGTLSVHLPQRLGEPEARGEGHFHLAPELFLQASGWTEFRFPVGKLRLRAGEAMVIPPQLRHAERVGPDGRSAAQAFRNLVVFADGPMLRCHVALERKPGRPVVAHLQALQHAQAPKVHDWLWDASRLGAGGDVWAQVQARSLVAAAVTGVLRALDEGGEAGAQEPPLVARVRVLIHNQLGDADLSVKRLAEQSGCSADHLSHVFHQASGETLVGCITRLRMARAASLLRETSLAGKEVAWACGFAAPSYFIRVFRQHHGMTPQAWRAGHAAS